MFTGLTNCLPSSRLGITQTSLVLLSLLRRLQIPVNTTYFTRVLGFGFRFRLLLHHAACYCQGTDDSGNEGADGVNYNAPVFSVKCHGCKGLKGLKSLKGLKGCGRLVRISNPQLYYTGITNPREHISLLRRLQIPVNTSRCSVGYISP